MSHLRTNDTQTMRFASIKTVEVKASELRLGSIHTSRNARGQMHSDSRRHCMRRMFRISSQPGEASHFLSALLEGGTDFENAANPHLD